MASGTVRAVTGSVFVLRACRLLLTEKVQLNGKLIATICLTAPAVLARNQHLVYSARGVAAAVRTLADLLTPMEVASPL